MQKIASNLIRQAKALANIDNTNSFAFSELFDYINAAYREVYVSMIESGDMCYVKELNVSGSGEFTLPDDFFQLAYIRTFHSTSYPFDIIYAQTGNLGKFLVAF